VSTEANTISYPPRFESLSKLQELVTRTYSAELWQAVKAGLALAASLSLSGRTNPLTLIFEGAPGRGKSTVVNMFAPDREENFQYLYRLDSFTPKSFVSHAANIPKKEMEQVDLLPKLKNKLLVTKELAPLFRGREEALRESFATLTAVLDGKGHLSASGVHGTRGYGTAHVFNWIGGTTPIPAKTDEIMAQLGNRLLRYEIVGEKESEADLVEFVRTYEARPIEDECKTLTNLFVAAYFQQFPPNSVDQSRIALTTGDRLQLVRLAKLTAQGRVELHRDDLSVDFIPGEPEGPQRLILLLRTYLLGFALLNPERKVNDEGIASVRHVAFSSIPRNRRRVLRALLTVSGELTTADAEKVLGVSQPTARNLMKELAATGLAIFDGGTGSAASRLVLADDWKWLLPQEAFAESETQLCEV
jgi:DNA-binding transcriptional ArsR family regulator